MPLYLKDGKLLVENGKLGTGAACCCGKCFGPCDVANPCHEECCCVDGTCVPNPDPGQPCPCSGPCDGENPCPEGCACVDGQCESSCACPVTATVIWFMPDNGGVMEGFCNAGDRQQAFVQDKEEADAKAQELAGILSANGWECGGGNGTALADMVPYGAVPNLVECDGFQPDDYIYTTYPEFALAFGRCCGTVDETAAPLDFGGVVTADVYVGNTYLSAVYPCIPNPLP